MMRRSYLVFLVVVAGCTANPDRHTIADLRHAEPPLEEVDVTDSLEKAMQGYRRFLAETPVNAQTPEALRRLADLQIEKDYGALVGNENRALPAPPARARKTSEARDAASTDSAEIADLSEAEERFEARAAEIQFGDGTARDALQMPDGDALPMDAGPRQAIATYQRILEQYPYYERNDQVLYQMARAHDELGETELAMQVMGRLIETYPDSKYLDEVQFRRGEFFFVRKRYLDAEDAYGAIIARAHGAQGATSADAQFYELALYKLGWTLYKQELYGQALHQYMALLDFKVAQGYDFDATGEEEEERRVADTFRVISLGFSNLGGPEVLGEYFGEHGKRSYEDRIYGNLGEFYVTKLRFNDAAVVYQSFVEQNPLHKIAPHFSMRVAEIYGEGGFPMLVVDAKKDFARRYGLEAEYWRHYAATDMPDVLVYLKTNLMDLAEHYHALYQEKTLVEEQGDNYVEALEWYRQFLTSFPVDEETPGMNYQLAELHLEQGEFATAAVEYERTAYDYPNHDQSSAAGYAAVFAHREHLELQPDEEQYAAQRATVTSSLKFANTFPDHEHAATVLGAATDDLYKLEDYEGAISAGLQLVEQHSDAEESLRRAAWLAVAHSYFDLARYADAEHGYGEVLGLTPAEDESRPELYENLAASIYQQGENAKDAQDFRLAAEHFLRIKEAAPNSVVRPSAEYDAAAALVELADWTAAAAVLEDFRATHTDSELQDEVTKQLAFVYQEAGELSRAADEYRQVAEDTDDTTLKSESMLVAAKLYRDAGDADSALTAYREHVDAFPEPVELNVETRSTIAELLLERAATDEYHAELATIVAIDAAAGADRTDRTRYLGAQSALVLAKLEFEHFAEMTLRLPFEQSLAEKKARMDIAMAALEGLVAYEVGDVTAAATFYIAETYRNFSNSLLESERPKDLSAAELVDYDLVIEEEAFPFEERAIEVHQANMELMLTGTHNDWVEQSLTELAVLMPGRYARFETSIGFIGSIDLYAYQSPVVEVLTAEADLGPVTPAEDEVVALPLELVDVQ